MGQPGAVQEHVLHHWKVTTMSVRGARIQEIAGAGHFGPRTATEAVAGALIHFFATTTTAQPLARREA